MHRATPSDSSFRGYAAGSRGGVVKSVTDSNGLQTCSSGMMKGESREDIEAPQNYGFTSVCADAGADGKGPECQFNYSGGNGSFPIAGAMDDRRHRLLELDKVAKGSTGMYGLKEWGQQLLNTEKGWFMTGNIEKKMRLQLVENEQKQGQQGGGQSGGGGGASATQFAAGGGGGGGGGGSEGGGQQGQDGQKTLHEKQSKYYVDITKERIEHNHEKRHKIMLDDKETAVDIVDGQVYVGKVKEKAGHQKLAHRGSIDSRGHGIVAKVSTNTWTPQGG
jgi:Bacteriophage Mu Gp45 spike protein